MLRRSAFLAGLAVLAIAAPAAANTYCVPAGGAPGCTIGVLNLQTALSDAQSNPGPDTIDVAAGTYPGPSSCAAGGFNYTATGTNSVSIVGAGTGQTVLTCPANYDATNEGLFLLSLNGPASVSGITLPLPGVNAEGLSLDSGASATNIAVTSVPSATNALGVYEESQDALSHAVITLPTSSSDTGLDVFGNSSADEIAITTGGEAIAADAYPGQVDSITHVNLTAPTGIDVDEGTIDVEDGLITLKPPASGSPRGIWTQNSNSGTVTMAVTARHLTIVGSPAGAVGVQSDAEIAGQNSAVTLADSVISGPATPLERYATTGATSNLTARYDDYPTAANSSTGAGQGTITEANVTSAAPGFVNPAGGNYALAAGSPLIDAGTSGALTAGEPTTDLAGVPRNLAGNGSCTFRRDIGAYEYVPTTPLPAAASAPAAGTVGQPVAFQATGCSTDPTATATFSWSFDDGATATGANVTHAFQTIGTHHANLTISDTDGHTGTAATALTIAPAITTTTTTTTTTTHAVPPATPTLGRLKLSPARFAVRQPRHHRKIRLGTKVAYTDTLPATTTLTITASAPGIASGKRCVPIPRHLPKHPHRCTRTVTLGAVTHHDRAGANTLAFTGRLGRHVLATGRYRLTLVARLGHHASRPASTTFAVTG